jgi:hypothetical protein
MLADLGLTPEQADHFREFAQNCIDNADECLKVGAAAAALTAPHVPGKSDFCPWGFWPDSS